MENNHTPRSDASSSYANSRGIQSACPPLLSMLSSPPLTGQSPILTYRGQGTTKPGVKSQHHAIIYTESASNNPMSAPSVFAGEHPLQNGPICVKPMDLRYMLDPTSRVNYAKVYTVEHNVKVAFTGRIHEPRRDKFIGTYRRI